MKSKKISVIMSTYNEPSHWIKASIESILNQSYKNLELIIVCDNPENIKLIDTLNFYKEKDNRVKVIINEKNLGLANSLNRALGQVTGEYIARMDSDDISYENRIEEQLNYLLENKLDLIGSGVQCIDENDNEIYKLNNFPCDNKNVQKKIIHNNCLAHPTWFGRVEIFKDNDGYRNIPYAEDYDFSLRALAKGYKLGNINKVLLRYRIRSSSISNKSGLKQFLVSQELVREYKERIINSEEQKVINNINEVLQDIISSDEDKYYYASTEFSLAAKKIKRFNPLGFINLLKAWCSSDYYRKKIMCYVRGVL